MGRGDSVRDLTAEAVAIGVPMELVLYYTLLVLLPTFYTQTIISYLGSYTYKTGESIMIAKCGDTYSMHG